MGLLETILHKVFRVSKRFSKLVILKVKRLFPKSQVQLSEIEEIREGQKEITIQGNVETRKYLAPYNARLKVQLDDTMYRGQVLNRRFYRSKRIVKS